MNQEEIDRLFKIGRSQMALLASFEMKRAQRVLVTYINSFPDDEEMLGILQEVTRIVFHLKTITAPLKRGAK